MVLLVRRSRASRGELVVVLDLIGGDEGEDMALSLS
tara:strand:+ start:1242 stop:1349 length:108 start_codon:yes stop_codon:yes gene_type:complete